MPIDSASIASTLSSRRCVARLAAEPRPRNASEHSTAGSIPMTLAPSVSTFMSSCSTPWCARVRVVADRGPDAAHLVGRDRRPHAGPADQDPPVRVPLLDREAQPLGEVRVVVLGVGPVAAEVDQLVLARGQPGELARTSSSLNSAPGVVGGEHDAHRRPGRAGRRSIPESPVRASGARRAATQRLRRPWRPSRTTRRPDVGHAVDREAELLEDRPGGGARPEVVDPDDRALVADVALPAQRHARLDGYALRHRRRQDLVAVRLVLRLEPLPARQAHDPRRDARRPRAPRRRRTHSWSSEPGADEDELRASRPPASRST